MHRRRQQAEPAEPAPKPRVAVRYVDERTDLTCVICQQVIAYGINPDRPEADDRFYLDQHASFCMASH